MRDGETIIQSGWLYLACDAQTQVRSKTLVHFGDIELDLSCVEQLAEKSQTRAISEAITGVLENYMRGGMPLSNILDQLERDFDEKGLDVLAPKMMFGQFARPRRFELAAAVNRLRTVKMLGR